MDKGAEWQSHNHVWEVRRQTMIDWTAGPNPSPFLGSSLLPWPPTGTCHPLTLGSVMGLAWVREDNRPLSSMACLPERWETSGTEQPRTTPREGELPHQLASSCMSHKHPRYLVVICYSYSPMVSCGCLLQHNCGNDC